MANVKISGLSPTGGLTTSHKVEVETSGGTSEYATIAQIQAMLPAGAQLQNGAGAPITIGNNGDFYIDTTNSRLYGPKASGTWPGTYTSLIGPTGATGSTGAAGQGVPTGGTTGQVLSKINSTNYNTQWVTVSGGGVSNHPGFATSRYYLPVSIQASSNGTSATNIWAMPFMCPANVTAVSLSANITTGASTGGVIGFAIYGADATTRLPTSNYLAKTNNVASTVSGTITASLVSSLSMTAGTLYWLMLANGSPSCTLTTGAHVSSFASLIGTPYITDVLGANLLTGMFISSFDINVSAWPDMTSPINGGWNYRTGSTPHVVIGT